MDKSISKKKDKWYIGGLHFECTGCGRCCSGPKEGYVWLRKAEMEFIAEDIGLTYEQVKEKYCRLIVTRYSLIEKKPSNDCIFLERTATGKSCEIYNSRPNQCRTWPFWSVNLLSPDMWNSTGVTCPGINRGKHYTFEQIEKLRKQEKWWGK